MITFHSAEVGLKGEGDLENIMILGHSHVRVLSAAHSRTQALSAPPHHCTFVNLHEDRFKPLFFNGGPNREILKQVEDFKRQNDNCFFAVSFFGALHTHYGLFNHPEPFDFIDMSGGVSAAVDKEKFYFTHSLIDAFVYDRSKIDIRLIREITQIFDNKVVYLQAPPPPKSSRHLFGEDGALKLEGPYVERVKNYGISFDHIPLFLWRAYDQLIGDVCEELNIPFLRIPSQMLDEDGFLSEEMARPADPTHGNIKFGGKILDQLASYIKAFEDISG